MERFDIERLARSSLMHPACIFFHGSTGIYCCQRGGQKGLDGSEGTAYRAMLFSNTMGNLTEGIMSGLIHHAVARVIRSHKRGNLLADSHSVYYLAPVEIDQTPRLYPTQIELDRKFCKVETLVFADGQKVAQSMLTARLME